MDKKLDIQFIGYGYMGSAIGNIVAKHTHDLKLCTTINIDDNKTLEEIDRRSGLLMSNYATFQKTRESNADLLFLCVKPQQINDVFLDIYNRSTTCVSIMNGISTKKLSHFDTIIRTMPNLLGEVGSGITGWFVSGTIDEDMKQFVQQLFTSSGIVIALQDEIQFSSFTAFAGCGPAIIAYIDEYCKDDIYRSYVYDRLKNVGCALGLGNEQAALIVEKLREGVPKYLTKYGINSNELINRVSSKGGSTECIIKSFQELGCEKMFAEQEKNIQALLFESILAGKTKAEEITIKYST